MLLTLACVSVGAFVRLDKMLERGSKNNPTIYSSGLEPVPSSSRKCRGWVNDCLHPEGTGSSLSLHGRAEISCPQRALQLRASRPRVRRVADVPRLASSHCRPANRHPHQDGFSPQAFGGKNRTAALHPLAPKLTEGWSSGFRGAEAC